MSVLAIRVTDENVEVAADSQVTYGDMKVHRGNSLDDAKLWFIHPKGVLAGVVGSLSYAGVLRRWTMRETPNGTDERAICDYVDRFNAWQRENYPDPDKHSDDGLSFVLAFGGRVWVVDDVSVSEVPYGGYMAHGSGAPVAIGALAVDASVSESVAAACKHNVYCSGPIVNAVMKRNGSEVGKIVGNVERIFISDVEE